MHRHMMFDTLAQSSLDGPGVLGKVRASYETVTLFGRKGHDTDSLLRNLPFVLS